MLFRRRSHYENPANPSNDQVEFPSERQIGGNGTAPEGEPAPEPTRTTSNLIVGDGALAIRCGEILLDKGHRIAAFVSRFALTRAWAEERGILTLPSPANLAGSLAGLEIDYLFSIVNDDILPPEVLALPRRAAINYHDGPLPRYAGVHATSWALIHGETTHGITWHLMSDEVDAGDILAQGNVDILPDDTALTLNTRCFENALEEFGRLIDRLVDGTACPVRQDLSQRTLYPRHQRPAAACVIDWNRSSRDILSLVRALDFGHHPNTIGRAKLALGGRFFIVASARAAESRSGCAPGTLVAADAKGLTVATADSDILVTRILDVYGVLQSPDAFPVGAVSGIDAATAALLTRRNAKLCRHKSFWAARLESPRPATLPYLRLSTDANPGDIVRMGQLVPHPLGADAIAAAFIAFVARLNGAATDAFEIGYAVEGFPGLIASEVPLVAKVDLGADFHSHLAVAAKELATVRRRDSYLHDLRTRMPALRNKPALCQNIGLAIVDSPDAFSLDTDTSRFRLAIARDGASCQWTADSSVIAPADLERLRDQFTLFLDGIARTPERALHDLPIIAGPSGSMFLDDAPTEIIAEAPLHRVFEQQAARTPDAIALTYEDQSLTYRELNRRANALARHLRDEHAIGPDTLVGICCERDPDVVIGILGILKAGGAYLPIDLAYPADRIAFMLGDSQAPVLLTQRRLADQLPDHQAAVIFLDDLESDGPAENLEGGAGLDDLAYVIFTSGSTGKPKGALITHRNVVRLMRATEHWFGFNEQDTWTLFHSYAFDFSVWELWGPLFYGGRLVVVPYAVTRNPRDFHQLLVREKVTVLNQTPSAFRQLIRAEEENGQLPLCLRYVIFGGEALEMRGLKPWFDRHGDRDPVLVNMYGITETTVHVTYRPLNAHDLDSGSVIGEPIPDLRIHILDPQQNPVPVGVPGEMYVAGAGLARGYLHRDELTRERFITLENTRLYRTGDVARFLPDGDIEYLGRCDDQVKIRGFRIELGEIESVLCQHPSVREACVIAREDTPGEKRLAAYLVARGSAPTVAALREHLLLSLPDYMVPAAFVFLDSFPLTNNGKTDRRALPVPGSGRADLGTDFVPPATDTERRLCALWEKVLKIEPVGIRDHFFEIGGDSILGIQIVAKARQQGIMLTPRHFFEFPTITELAARVGGESPPSVAPITGDPIPLTPIQHWFFEQELARPGHYNQSFLLDCREALDPDKLQAALVTVVNHHDALRLTFRNGHQTYGSPIAAVPLDGATSFDLASGCLLHSAYDAGKNQLFLAVHHLAIDGVSWRILLEDLESAYRGRPLPPKSASFADWSAALQGYSVPPEERTFWNRLPATSPPARILESETSKHTVSLTPEETIRLLRDVPSAHGVRINDVLLTALARAFDRDDLVVDMEGHGREHIIADLDVSRTVGWFTSIFPVRLDPAGIEQLAGIPHHGIGYGILRYLAKSIKAPVEPEVIFNYLGQFDEVVADSGLFAFASDQAAPWHAPDNARRHPLEVTTLIRNGRFELTIAYADRESSEIEATAERFLAALRSLMEREDSFPLAPLQDLYYTLESARPNAGLGQWHCRITGPVDPARLRAAWQATLDRHSALRTSFAHDGQTVHPRVPIDFREISATPADFERLLAEDAALGFDLTNPPLTRVTLVRFAEADHRLVWTHHHLQIDGWSWPLVFADVAKAYAGESLGAAPSYHDFVEWLGTRDEAADRAFWTRALDGFTAPTPLPGRDHGNRFEEVTRTLSPELSSGLQRLARFCGVPLNTIVQAAWAFLLARQSGRPEVVFGAAFAGRPFELPESVGTVGVFVNNLPVRLAVADDTTPRQLFAALQRWQMDAGEHQYLPLGTIQECSAIPFRQRLFDSLIVFQNYEIDESIFRLGADALIDALVAPIRTNYPLTLVIEPREVLTIRAIHATPRFNETSITEFLAHFEHLLAAFVSDPDNLPSLAIPRVHFEIPAPARPEGQPFVAPRTSTERRIAALWQQAFGMERIGIHDNFFDLGGQSLLMVQVHARLRRDLGLDLPIVTVFKFPTIADLARHLDGETSNTSRPTRPQTRSQDGIAIIGMVGRFPGAPTVDALWHNLVEGRETIATISDDDLRAEGLDPAQLDAEGEYVRRRGLIERPEWFDAAFFGMHPREAEVTDPQQRLFLEAAWEALESAGYVPESFPGDIGVYGGMSNSTYYLNNVHNNLHLRHSVGELAAMMGSEKDYLATRVAYKLNLTGPAINVYNACSTSMVAVCQAAQGLLDGHCDMALAGGVSVTFPLRRGYYTNEGGITARDGHCRPFDLHATGTVFSDGLGLVVLKRLDDALADGDQIHAVIRGFGMNNDGSDKVSFTAPSVLGQSGAIRKALAMSGFDPASVTAIEAHGTGTPLGDPIEVAGLAEIYGKGKHPITLGSLKSNVGHMDAAAGVGGLIKATLALGKRQLPGTLHFTRPNPRIGLENTRFVVDACLRDWITADGSPLRAGVSSFGVGGTNTHVILEEAPPVPESATSRDHQLLVLSARSADALEAATSNLANHLEAHPEQKLADVAWTLQTGRRGFNFRRALVADSPASAIAALRNPPKARNEERRTPPVVFMFPGQGSQHPNMGAELYRTEAVFRETVDTCAEILRPLLGFDLREVVYHGDTAEQLRQTRITQPALFVTEYALAKLWMSWGIHPDAMIGHSVGEYVAGALAGVFSLEDGLHLIAHRARLVQEQPPGAMLAIRAPEADVLPLLPESTAIAAVNAPGLCVAAGDPASIATLENTLTGRAIVAKHLHTSHAFHSAMMDPVIEPFTDLLRTVKLSAPAIPYVSNVTGNWITDAEATSPEYWASHVRQTVRFADGLRELLDGERVLIEVGPGNTLATLTRQHPGRAPDQAIIASLPGTRDSGREQAALLEALGQLWRAGGTIDWPAFHGGSRRLRVPLPTYPFERQRHWAEPCGPQMHAANDGAPAPAPTFIAPITTTSPMQPLSLIPEVTEARAERLIGELITELRDLSGINLDGADPETNFLELGFDSLFLTQASTAISRKYGVRITFRDLLENLDSPATLAAHLDATLPQDVARTPRPPAADASTPLPTSPAPTASLEARLARLEQLAGLAPAATAPVERPTGIRAPQNAKVASDKVSFGPFKTIEKCADGGLTEQQRDHLDHLISRYIEHTPTSRAHVQSHRHHLADPRAVVSFNPAWKDMVYPIVTERSEGAKLWDIDGNEYVDLTLGFGLSFLGHRPKFVLDAVRDQLDKGIEIGPSSPLAGEVAEMMCEVSGLDRVSFCNTGSEAVTAAIRIARTVTGRDLIAMFEGAYHGIFDEILARPITRNGELRSMPIAPGIPEAMTANIIVLEYGNPESLQILRENADRIAAVLVETVQSRRPGLVPVDFLRNLRVLTEEHGTALVFDEVVTGFRTHLRGSQGRFDIQADIATYGKVIGGGFPIGVVCGKRKFMDALDGGHWQYGDDSFPEVGVTFFAGTFVRWPLALAAAKAVLTHLFENSPRLQDETDALTAAMVDEMNAFLGEAGVPVQFSRYSSMFMPHAAPELKYHALLYFHMRLRGIHMWERPCFLSAVHTDEDCRKVLDALRESVHELQRAGFFPGTAPDGPQSPVSFALTESQREMFLATKLNPESASACNDSVSLHLDGPLDLELLREAFTALTRRHEALRTVFDEEGASQTVLAEMTVELPLEDVSHLDPAARATRLAEARRQQNEMPFNLATGPLFRVVAFRTAPEMHEVILTLHHIICDGVSMEVLTTSLVRIYARSAGESLPPLPAPVPFRQFAAWQRRTLAGAEGASAREYWLGEFEIPPPPLDLPSDHPRPSERSYRAGTVRTILPRTLADDVRQLSATRKASPFTTLIAGLQALLHRLSGQDDLVVGFAVAGQSAMSADRLVGHCVNFLPLRARLNAGLPFAEFLSAQKAKILDAFEHQHFTVGALLKELPLVHRDPSRPALASVSFTLEEAPTEFAITPELTALVETSPKQRLIFDLSIYLKQSGDGYLLECVYSRDLYTEATVRRWLRFYENLLTAATRSPETPIGALEIMDEPDLRLLAGEWSGIRTPYPSRHTVGQLFEEQAARTSDAIALRHAGEDLTYRELNHRANAVARHLRDLGVQPGTFVGLLAERSPDLLVALVGTVKAGCAHVPLDPSYPADRLAFMVADTAPSIVITQRHLSEKVSADTRVVFLEDLASLDPVAENLPGNATPDSPFHVIYTSGSTGRPKGSVISHRGVVRLVKETNFIEIRADDVFLQAAPISFDASTFEIWAPLLNGATLAIPAPGTPSLSDIGTAIRDFGVTTLWLTSGLFQLMVDERLDDLRPLRNLVAGGDVLSPTHVRKAFEALPGCRIINGYGPTENSTFTCCHTVTREDLERESIPIGRPVANTNVYLLDNQLRLTPPGVAGEMYIGGDGLALGYHNLPVATDEKFVPNPFGPGRLYRSGDLCRFLPDGTLQFIGRIDSQIKVRGFRLEPGEIESALNSHPAVRQSVAVASGDSAGEKILVAYVVADEGRAPSTAELRSHLKARLPDYMIPTAIVTLDALPLTTNGKIDYRRLPGPGEGDRVADTKSEAPISRTEAAVTRIWEEVLARSPLGLDDNFFDLGGHSLLGLRIFNRIESELQTALTLNLLFSAPTIRELAAHLDRAQASTVAPDAPPTPESPPRPLPRPGSSVVALQPLGNRTPVYFIHALGGGDGGGPFKYQRLANLLGKEQPSYGLRAAAEPFATVESMAETFVSDLREIQPHGPYQLAGYCMAAAVTFEMARQLDAAGEQARLVALLDGTVLNYGEIDGPSALAAGSRRARQILRGFLRTLRKGPAQTLKRIGKAIARHDQNGQNGQNGSGPRLEDLLDMNEYPEAARAYATSHWNAFVHYHPAEYTGRVTFFAPAQPSFGLVDPQRVWEKFARGGVDVIAIPGDHDSILRDPDVVALAKALESRLLSPP